MSKYLSGKRQYHGRETISKVYDLIEDTKISIRNTSQDDIEKIVKLQRQVYPEVASGQFYAPFFIEKHLEVFPEGQFCAEVDGKIVGSATALIVTIEPEYREHTWYDVVGYGNETSHQSRGDSLYADDILTHPSYRRIGIGSALMKARMDICLKKGLRRIIGGGRLYNYCLYANQMSADKYARLVIKNYLIDPVLSFQLKNQFKYIKILPNYLLDSRSLNFATFIEWKRSD